MYKMCKRSLYLTHKEAHSIIFHLNSETNPEDFVIRTSNNVLVIALRGMGNTSTDIKAPFLFS